MIFVKKIQNTNKLRGNDFLSFVKDALSDVPNCELNFDEHFVHYSITHANEFSLISFSKYKNALDTEYRPIPLKYYEKLFNSREKELIANNVLTSEQIWSIKECLIKYNSLMLSDIIYNTFDINYLVLSGEVEVIEYNSTKYYLKFKIDGDLSTVVLSEIDCELIYL